MEPYRLRRWRSRSNHLHKMYTCARPGRSKGRDGPVSDSMVDTWVIGLPGKVEVVIVSLLGRKPDGESEFSFYSFHGQWDEGPERRKKLSFQEWINHRKYPRTVRVIEHPTWDFRPVPQETVEAVSADICVRLGEGLCVVLMDSGGETRTKRTCAFMGFTEDSAIA
jgi:hypothetical protein